ncbi:hypothetical protein [Corynebacterium alimapuense]|uniref:PepSY domain-containing protein n=1 Tax=Corynebacterium alimapuense TaxID=1576874 RepID=A0A3M8K7V8_9CORY|nr:hypothetical protein [Corynebacterium alimapuense]RNE49317.1 hypothetical protein C5L39_02825 [Corynebacterium alimapuense]
MTSRLITTTVLALSSGLVLSACSSAEDATTEDTGTDAITVTSTAAQDTTAAESTVAETTAAETTPSSVEEIPTPPADPVFAAIDEVLAEYSNGIIIDIDREDDRNAYDIEVVAGDEVIDLEVDPDGNIREEERDNDGDDVAKAQSASVTAAEAIRQALDEQPEGFLDEVELDDDRDLSWEIDLDDADGRDLAELSFPAN